MFMKRFICLDDHRIDKDDICNNCDYFKGIEGTDQGMCESRGIKNRLTKCNEILSC